MNKADKATTLSGYGITDAYTQGETDELISEVGNSAIWTATNAPTTPDYTFSISDLVGQAGLMPKEGDVILHGGYIYTISDVDTTTVKADDRMSVQGERGATWYAGTAITGTSTTPTIFSGSGITDAIAGDHYLNSSTQNVYICTLGGNASTALWKYEQNIKGSQGIPGEGMYIHTKYSDDGGQTFTGNSGEDPGNYIGIKVDENEQDPTTVSAYDWIRVRGDEVTTSKTGATTTIFVNGVSSGTIIDGKNVHVAWADNITINPSTGAVTAEGFSTTTATGKKYLGSYTDNNTSASLNPSDYNWVLIKGAAGTDGVSVALVETQYYLSTRSDQTSGGSWSNSPQTFVSGKYYWTRDKITYSNNTIGYSAEVYNQGLTLANEYALSANEAASNALAGLATLESVIDTVNWFAEHKVATTDTTVNSSKTYYIYDSVAGTLTEADPDGTENPSQEGWFELDEAISNYVASHIASTDDGLYVVGLSNGWKVLVSSGTGSYTAGVYILDPTGGIAQATTASGFTFDNDKPYYIGDNDAYISFDGNGHITIGGTGITLGTNKTLSSLLTELGQSLKAVEYGKGSSSTSHSDITSWSTTTPTWEDGKYIWMRTTTNGLNYTYTCIQGARGQQGIQGNPGNDGTSITVTNIRYAVSTTDSQPSDSSFTYDSVPTVAEGSWLWTRTLYSDGSKVYTKAKQGAQGSPGNDGTSITITNIRYAVSDTETQPADSSFTYSSVPTVAEGKWLWTRTLYSDGSKVYTKAKQGQTGAQGTSVTVSSVAYAYQLSTSGTTIPSGTWQTTPQAPTTTQYAWTRTTTTYSDGSTAVTYTVGGKTGTDGTSPTVTNSKTQYQKSTSGTSVPTGTWSDTALAPDEDNYVWTKTTITYSNGNTAVAYAVAGKQGAQGIQGIQGEAGENGKLLYGTCSTAAGTAAKSVTCSDAEELYAGLTITVKFSNANTTLAPTLNVNSLGAKAVWVDNAVTSTSNCLFWNTNAVITFMYDGTQFIVVDQPTTYYTTCSTAAGTTAKAAACAACVVRKGTTVTVRMTNAHTGTSAATLYVNGQSGTARNIYVNGSTVTSANANSWASGEAVPFVFNGQYWYASRGEKGTAGDPGYTPYVQDGYWYINGTSTGVKATGDDGETPYIQSGYWYINGTSTGVKAEGTDGHSPTITASKTGDTTTIYSDGVSIGSVVDGSDGESSQWYYGTSLTHTSGTATLSTSTTPGVIVGSMYLNTSSSNVYKCTAISGTTATWTYATNIKGAQGATPTITNGYWYINGTSTGVKAQGTDGTTTIWYYGNKITGTSTTPTVFSGSGITNAVAGDMYLNNNTSNIYQCTLGGNAATAAWVYAGSIADGVLDNIEIGGRNLYVIIDAEDGYLDSDGSIATQNSTRKEQTSDFIPVSAFDQYVFQNWVTPTIGATEGLWMAYAFYDSSKNFISGTYESKTAGLNTGLPQHEYYQLTVPYGASYLRISARLYDDGLIKLEKGNVGTDWTASPEDINSAINGLNIDIHGTPLFWSESISTVTTANAYPVVVNDEHIKDSSGNLLYWNPNSYTLDPESGQLNTPNYSTIETSYPVMSNGEEVLSYNLMEAIGDKADKTVVEDGLAELDDKYDTLKENTESDISRIDGDLGDVITQSQTNADSIDAMTDELSANTNALANIRGRINFDSSDLIIGDEADSNILITNEEIDFRYKTTVGASMDREQLNVTTANVTYLKLGPYILENTSDGGLILKERE